MSQSQTTAKPAAGKPRPNNARRVFWLRQLREWHWISSAVCLIGLIGFAATGITLNHAGQISAKPVTETHAAVLPPAVLALLKVAPAGSAPLPGPVSRRIARDLKVDTAGRPGDWSDDEVYVSLPRPGGDAAVTVDRITGEVSYEKTTRGAIALLNDLHKGRNTGPAWSWFIDIFAVACLVFAITGLFLLYLLSATRRITWPLVALGLVVPAVLVVVFIHL
jgi:hypothetical protein